MHLHLDVNRDVAQREYWIVGNSVVPLVNAPRNTSEWKQSDAGFWQLSVEHQYYGMTDGDPLHNAMCRSLYCLVSLSLKIELGNTRVNGVFPFTV